MTQELPSADDLRDVAYVLRGLGITDWNEQALAAKSEALASVWPEAQAVLSCSVALIEADDAHVTAAALGEGVMAAAERSYHAHEAHDAAVRSYQQALGADR